MPAMVSLKDVLKAYAEDGELYFKLPDLKTRCNACSHRCVILPGAFILREACTARPFYVTLPVAMIR
jgi:hypothetical protein